MKERTTKDSQHIIPKSSVSICLLFDAVWAVQAKTILQ